MNLLEFNNGVIPFCWDRLQLDRHTDIDGRTPCLQEDWFAEQAVAAGSPFIWRGRDPETSHRMLYRYARAENLQGRMGGYHPRPHLLMLKQMVLLIPMLFMKAASLVAEFQEQAP